MRDKFRRILRGVCGVFPASKAVAFLAAGLGGKNSRSRVECLEEIAAVVERHGLEAHALFILCSRL